MVGRARLLLQALSTLLCLTPCTAPARAQVAHDGQLWINTTVFGSVGDFAYFAEVQPRFGENVSQRDQLLLRPAIGWRLNDRVRIHQGYAYVETSFLGQAPFFENRSFQQLDWKVGRFAGVLFSTRTRFEQRRQSDGRDTGLRVRQFVQATRPLADDEENGLAALAWNETFFALNDTDWGARAGLDRVRTFVGIRVPTVGKSTVEVGYLNQTVNLPRGGVDMDHVLSLSIFFRD